MKSRRHIMSWKFIEAKLAEKRRKEELQPSDGFALSEKIESAKVQGTKEK